MRKNRYYLLLIFTEGGETIEANEPNEPNRNEKIAIMLGNAAEKIKNGKPLSLNQVSDINFHIRSIGKAAERDPRFSVVRSRIGWTILGLIAILMLISVFLQTRVNQVLCNLYVLVGFFLVLRVVNSQDKIATRFLASKNRLIIKIFVPKTVE